MGGGQFALADGAHKNWEGAGGALKNEANKVDGGLSSFLY